MDKALVEKLVEKYGSDVDKLEALFKSMPRAPNGLLSFEASEVMYLITILEDS